MCALSIPSTLEMSYGNWQSIFTFQTLPFHKSTYGIFIDYFLTTIHVEWLINFPLKASECIRLLDAYGKLHASIFPPYRGTLPMRLVTLVIILNFPSLYYIIVWVIPLFSVVGVQVFVNILFRGRTHGGQKLIKFSTRFYPM